MIKINNKEQFCKSIGYNNTKPCIKKLEFLEKHGIEKYLQTKYKYDFVLGSEILLKKVIEAFGNKEDRKLFEYIRDRLSRDVGYLFIETNFKRASQPIFVLAIMEGSRNFKIDRYKFKNKEEELKFIKDFVKKHYKENSGKIELWGKIKHYVYKSDWFDNYLIIDIYGNIINEVDDYRFYKASISI